MEISKGGLYLAKTVFQLHAIEGTLGCVSRPKHLTGGTFDVAMANNDPLAFGTAARHAQAPQPGIIPALGHISFRFRACRRLRQGAHCAMKSQEQVHLMPARRSRIRYGQLQPSNILLGAIDCALIGCHGFLVKRQMS